MVLHGYAARVGILGLFIAVFFGGLCGGGAVPVVCVVPPVMVCSADATGSDALDYTVAILFAGFWAATGGALGGLVGVAATQTPGRAGVLGGVLGGSISLLLGGFVMYRAFVEQDRRLALVAIISGTIGGLIGGTVGAVAPTQLQDEPDARGRRPISEPGSRALAPTTEELSEVGCRQLP
jgi:hypothetical protein